MSGKNISEYVFTVRQGNIIEIPKEQLKSHETAFESHKEAVTYQVATFTTHNFNSKDKEVLFNNFKEITSRTFKNYPPDLKSQKIAALKELIPKEKNIDNFEKDMDKAKAAMKTFNRDATLFIKEISATEEQKFDDVKDSSTRILKLMEKHASKITEAYDEYQQTQSHRENKEEKNINTSKSQYLNKSQIKENINEHRI